MKYVQYFCVLLMVFGLAWEIKIWLDHFDTIFTPRLSMQLFWKPLVCIIVGYVGEHIASYLKHRS